MSFAQKVPCSKLLNIFRPGRDFFRPLHNTMDKNGDCEDGAFYIGGGKEVEVNAQRLSEWMNVNVRYCIFSPSSEGQSVTVEFGLKDYSSILNDLVTLVYRKGDGSSGTDLCFYAGTCTRTLGNAYYYVSYSQSMVSPSKELYYSRTNHKDDDLYTACSKKAIPYYPLGFADTPYGDISLFSSFCWNKEQHRVKQIFLIVVWPVAVVLAGIVYLIIWCVKRCNNVDIDTDHSGRYLSTNDHHTSYNNSLIP